MRGITKFAFVILLIAALAHAAPVAGGTASPPRGGGPIADPSAPIKIATGADINEDGYLFMSPDEYGSFGAFGILNGITEDQFKPAGGLPLVQTTFTSGFFIFVDGGGQELLSDQQEWQDVFPGDASLDRAVTSANVASDTNGDSVDDTLASSFRVFGGATDLSFDLMQTVATLGGGVSQLRQDYNVTNDGTAPITFVLVRSYDGDLLWDSDFGNDSVGTTMHGAGLGTYVYMEEFNIPGDTAVTVSGDTGRNYWGAKNGVEPPLGPPPFGFGTDVQVWDNFGIPTSWVNFIAGGDYDMNGDSGEFPPGVADPGDGSVGMDWEITLNPGESTNVNVLHTYGQSSPGGCLLSAQIAQKLVNPGDPVRVRVSLKHRKQQTVTVPFKIWLEDRHGNVIVRETTPEYTLEFGDTLRFVWPLQLPADVTPGRYRVRAGVARMLQGTAHSSQPVTIDVLP